MTTTTTQGPALPIGGGNQPLDRNIPITLTCQGGSLPVIRTQASTKQKKMEEPKNGGTPPVPSPHTTPAPSLHTTLVPSPHITLISSPYHSHIPSVSAPLLKSSGSPI